jgi:hypothetical protein
VELCCERNSLGGAPRIGHVFDLELYARTAVPIVGFEPAGDMHRAAGRREALP